MTTKQAQALKQAQSVLRGLTFKSDAITGALEAIHSAQDQECRPPAYACEATGAAEGWKELPQRLRGRGDFLRECGRVKDSELMYDAASEIEHLRSRK